MSEPHGKNREMAQWTQKLMNDNKHERKKSELVKMLILLYVTAESLTQKYSQLL